MAEDNVHRQIERIRQTTQKITRIYHIMYVLAGTLLFLLFLVISGGFRDWMWVTIPIGLALIFLAWYLPKAWPKLYCPYCNTPISSVLWWICGDCFHENKHGMFTGHLYTNKCGHCEKIPTGLICPECDETIVFDERANAEERRIARELGWEPSSQGAQSEEKAQERKPSAGDEVRERMAKRREWIADAADIDAASEEEEKKLKAELAAGEITEDQYEEFENDLKDFVHQARVRERLRENDEE